MKIIRRVLITILCCCLTYYVYNQYTFDRFTLRDDNRYILSSYGKCVYSLDTENTIYVNLTGLSNGINKLLDEGFVVYSIETGNNFIDIIIQNSQMGVVYRYYYELPQRKLTCFCNTYENSYKAVTYITE